MSSAQRRRRREEGSRLRRPTESFDTERHRRGHERRLVPELLLSAASRKRPSNNLFGSNRSRRVYVFAWLVGVMGMGRGRVSAQNYFDGGKVSMKCGDCSCDGTSDDGTIDVFQSPSSGEMVASVNGGYSEVLETTCDSSMIAVGDNLYELSGVDFIERETDVVDMSSAECAGVDIEDHSNCYSGQSSSSLDGGIELSVTICYCKHVDGIATAYRSNVGATVKGATAITVPGSELHICFDFDYVSQMAAFVVSGSTYYFDFELAIPGEDTSSDLSVAAPPPSSAETFLCGGEEVEPTPSPVDPTPPTPEPTAPPTPEPTAPPVPDPTPAPLKPTAPPVDPTTPAPTVITPSPVVPDPTPPPQPPPTTAPTPPPTPGPVVPEPEPTSSPIAPEPEPEPTSAPAVDPTSAPLKPVPVPELTPGPVAPTPEPTKAPVRPKPTPEPTLEPTLASVTRKPSVAPALGPTTAPIAPPTASTSPAPSIASNTSRPAGTVTTPGPLSSPTATPLTVPTGAPIETAKPTLRPSAAENVTSPAPSTAVPSSSERTVWGETAAPVTASAMDDDEEGLECDLPLEASCTQNPGFGDINSGIGVFYDPVCNTTSTAGEKEPGCQDDSEGCRLCLFSTTRFMESNPGDDLPNYGLCPCCVLSSYKEEASVDADSSICENTSPAPIAVTTAPTPGALGSADRAARTQSFQDRSLRVGGGNGVAVAALGLLSVLTFLPICSK